MGIEGLHNLIKPCLETLCLNTLWGQTAVIDAMSFIYKGCYSCSYELNNNIPTKGYMLYLLRIIRLVKANKVKVVVIFDGRFLDAKSHTLKLREAIKEKNLNTAKKHQDEGNDNEARKFFSRCLRTTKEMIYDTIDVLRANGTDVLMAPYEADPQLAYMVRSGQADFAISEDSDLVCYGCPRIAFKLQLDSTCQFFDWAEFATIEQRKRFSSEPLRCFLGMDEVKRVFACVMAGSDYFPSIPGIGMKKAIGYLERFGSFSQVMERLKSEICYRDKIPSNYEAFVEKVAMLFRHQRVYDRVTKKQILFTPLDNNIEGVDRHKQLSKEEEQLVGKEIPYFEEVSIGKRHIYTLEEREEVVVDMKALFNGHASVYKKFESQPRSSQKKQSVESKSHQRINHQTENPEKRRDNPLATSFEEKEDYLLSLLEAIPDRVIHEEEYGDIEENDQEIPEEKEDLVTITKNETKMREKKAHLQFLCDTFLRDFAEEKKEITIAEVIQPIQRVRQTIEEQKLTSSGQKRRNFNPFQLKKATNCVTYQPDSLDDLNLEKLVEVPQKKKEIIIIKTESKSKVTIKDFFGNYSKKQNK